MIAPKYLAPLASQIEEHCPELNWDDTKPTKLGNDGTVLLASLLQEHSDEYSLILQSISLTNSGIASDGVIALLAALFRRPARSDFSAPISRPYVHLHTLKLRGNAIGGRGVKALAQVLGYDTQLKILDLYDNAIGDVSMRPLLEALRVNRTLRSLNLWYNGLSVECAAAMGSLMLYNFGLKRLLLGGNDLGDDACAIFSSCLKLNTKLIELDLSGNTMSDSSRDELAQTIRRNIKFHKAKKDANNASLDFCTLPQFPKSGLNKPRPSSHSPEGAISSVLSDSSTPLHILLLHRAFRNEKDFFQAFCATHAEYLCSLSLAKTELATFPSSLLSARSLTSLDMRSNHLTSLPPEFSDSLRELRVLFLSHNEFEALPDTIVMLTHLEAWSLHANPLSLIPRVYLDSSLYPSESPQKTALWKYLSSIRSSGAQEIRLAKAKVMIVGDANVGKTSLLQCLPHDFSKVWTRWSHKLPKPLATDGIDIEAVKISLAQIEPNSSLPQQATTAAMAVAHAPIAGAYMPSSTSTNTSPSSSGGSRPTTPTSPLLQSSSSPSPILPGSNLNYEIWDFAGQDVYYATHSFFLTQNTIYLVVFDLSRCDAAQAARIDYWIQSVQTRVGTTLSYILLVGTHADDISASASSFLLNLHNRYVLSRDVLEIVTVSCKTGQGVEILKTALNNVANKFGLAHQVYPKSWLQIGDVLKAIMTVRPWIPYDQLLDISRQFYVQPSAVELGVLPALKDLGTVLHFSDPQLQDTVFLNPQFVVKAFADVLTIKHRGFIKSDGILRLADLTHLFQDDRRSFGDLLLVKLFELFDVAIRLDAERLLIPALLNDDVPPFLHDHWPYGWDDISDWNARSNSKLFFRRNYLFRFLPLGFFPKLIAQCYRSMSFDIICHWKNGIVAASNDGDRALLTFDDHKFLLRLRVEGNPYSFMLTQLVQLINTLIKGWYSNAHYEVCVPVPTESLGEFALIPHDTIMEAVRLASDNHAVITLPSDASQESSVSPQPVHVDEIAPDLALAGMQQLTLEELDKGLQYSECVGKGGQGQVFRGVFNQTQTVAIKDFDVLPTASRDDFETQQEWNNYRNALKLRSQLVLQHEALILHHASDHPSIVRLVGFNIHRSLLLLDFVPLENVGYYLLRDLDPQPHEYRLNDALLQVRIALDIASAMSYLHSRSPAILHRDLSSTNIMLETMDVSAPVVAKIVDFGIASFAGKTGLGAYHNEKWYCVAPEVIQNHDHSHKSDVYSFGILLWQLWSGLSSHGLGPKDTVRGLRPALDQYSTTWDQVPVEIHQKWRSLFMMCWNADPEMRPSFVDVLSQLILIAADLGLDPEHIQRLSTDLSKHQSILRTALVGRSSGWRDRMEISLGPTGSGLPPEITAAALFNPGHLIIGTNTGRLHWWREGEALSDSLRVSENKTIVSILPIDSLRALCLTSTSVSVVQQNKVCETAHTLAGSVFFKLSSPERFLLGTAVGTISLWNTSPLERVNIVYCDEPERIVGMSSMDESHENIVIVSEARLYVLHVPTFSLTRVPRTEPISSPIICCCAQNKSLWLGCLNGSIETGELSAQAPWTYVRTELLKAHTKQVMCIASSSSNMVSAGEDGIFWWNSNTAQRPLRGLHRAPITQILVASDDLFYSIAQLDGSLMSWRHSEASN